MAYIFDGKAFAKEREKLLSDKVLELKNKGIIPALASVIVGTDPASMLYVEMKKKAAERIGAKMMIIAFGHDLDKKTIIDRINEFNSDPNIHGIMVQLPLPRNFSDEDRDVILNSIAPEKDVDGLRLDSKFKAPTTKAVVEILHKALTQTSVDPKNICIVGGTGNEGRKMVKALKEDYKDSNIVGLGSKTGDLASETQKADVLISVTGVPGLIKADMVKDGAILIDVGSPKGDIEKTAYEKASFVSPVPGGVGPMTISCLLENLAKVIIQ